MRLILWIIGFILAVTVTAFAVFNRHAVDLHLSPVHAPLELPLYLIVVGFMACGFLAGAFIVWINGSGVRKSNRRQMRQIREMQKDLQNADEKVKQATPPSDFFPALPALRRTSNSG